MITYSRFKRTIGPGMCRKCINRLFGLNLQPKDCVYFIPADPVAGLKISLSGFTA